MACDVNYILGKINSATTHSELKDHGQELFVLELTNENRTAAVKVYRAKRKELDNAMVAAAPKGSLLSKALYHVNTMGGQGKVSVAKCGKIIFDISKNGKYSTAEQDLIFRSYSYRKDMIAKAAEKAA